MFNVKRMARTVCDIEIIQLTDHTLISMNPILIFNQKNL